MIPVDIKSLLSRLNPACTQALEAAAGVCVSRSHYEVTIEHMLIKMLEFSQNDLDCIFAYFNCDRDQAHRSIESQIAELKTGNTGKPTFDPSLLNWIQDAYLLASVNFEDSSVRSGILLLALLKKPERLAFKKYAESFKSVVPDTLQTQFHAIVKNSTENKMMPKGMRSDAAPAGGSALEKFCMDFTRKAKENGLDPVFGRERELHQMIDILARRRKNNPILVGEAGVGKTAVVEGLAIKIVEGNVPDSLKDVSIYGLDMGLLQAGAGMKGEFENRLKSIIDEVKASPKPLILFIDEAHTMIGAGGQAGGSDAANLLKPALARGELRTVAATTWSEYKKYFEKDPALARRFQPIKVEEPSLEDAVLILRGLKSRYEKTHGVTVSDKAIVAAAEYSSRYISGRQLPDKAVDLLDTSAARVKVMLSSKPPQIDDKEREIESLTREKIALERDALHGGEPQSDRILQIVDLLAQLETEKKEMSERWEKEKELAAKLIDLRKEMHNLNSENAAEEKILSLKQSAKETSVQLEEIQGDNPLVFPDVNPDLVAQVVCDWTGIPLGKVLRDEAENMMDLDSNLSKRIRGQDHAIDIISQAMRSSKAGLSGDKQPLGVFLLVGPSGVGKTESATSVADLLFGGEKFLVTINMSEFQESHSVSRLIGSPPGYVGFGEGGVLTEAVRQKPYSVVLIDEAEKAHIDVMNLFYQVFDKGELSDGEGRKIDFKNTVIFLTSNLASEEIISLTKGEKVTGIDGVLKSIKPILSRHFKPALLARMTVVPYFSLQPSFMKEIIRIKLDQLVDRLQQSHRIKLTYSGQVIDQIAARCTEVESGARNIDHIVRGTILPALSQTIISKMAKGNLPSELQLTMAQGGDFVIDEAALALKN